MSKKQLTRSTEDRWLGGVCAGIGDYTGQDANLVRLLVVAVTVLGLGSIIIVYLLAWVIMPEQSQSGPPTIVHEPPPPSA